jgi:tRNA pseudouridine38-40 synthase
VARYAVKIYYDGRKYFGFQIQKERKTVAYEIIRALKESKLITDPTVAKFQAASRTDKGVSALSQTIAFDSAQKFSMGRINAFLPDDITAWAWCHVHEKFNPKKEAIEKNYVYIQQYESEDMEVMKKASKLLIGEHDFRHFVKKAHKSCLTTLNNLEILKQGDFIVFNFYAKSFLWEMVRRIVTILIKIGKGEVGVNFLEKLLRPTDSKIQVIQPAPAENLLLFDIKYNLNFKIDEKARREIMERIYREIVCCQIKKLCLEKLTSYPL